MKLTDVIIESNAADGTYEIDIRGETSKAVAGAVKTLTRALKKEGASVESSGFDEDPQREIQASGYFKILYVKGLTKRHIKRIVNSQSSERLPDFMAKACHYAQDHIDDSDAWPHDQANREQYLTCVSYQMACFLAQNTVNGHGGVESDVLIDELTARPMKSEKQWLKIIERIAKELGGWK